MSSFRNLPTGQAKALNSLITVRENQVVSMALTRGDSVQMTLLAFAEGEDVSEEQYFGDTLYYMVEGSAVIRMAGEQGDGQDGGLENGRIRISAGEVLMVPAHTLHAVTGEGAFKILQITLGQ